MRQKTKNVRNQGSNDKKNRFFGPVPKLHTQMGSLSAKNANEKFSRLGPFKFLRIYTGFLTHLTIKWYFPCVNSWVFSEIRRITTGLTLVCKQRDDEELNVFLHNEQANSFSPVCTQICLTKPEFWLKDGALERLLLTLQIWLFRYAWIHDCHNCLLVLQVVGMIKRSLIYLLWLLGGWSPLVPVGLLWRCSCSVLPPPFASRQSRKSVKRVQSYHLCVFCRHF